MADIGGVLVVRKLHILSVNQLKPILIEQPKHIELYEANSWVSL